MKKKRQLSCEKAVELIQDHDTIILGGFVGAVVPEALERALGKRYLNTRSPHSLNLIFAAGQGDGKERAINHLAQDGMINHVIGGHWGLVPKLQDLATQGKITGHNLPQGVICQLYRDSAAGKPGTLSHVGLQTFVDPRLEGGKINSQTKQERVELLSISGQEMLFYPRITANVAFLRGTTADENGNISMEEECLFLENLAIAQLVHNQVGTVFVQVKRIVPAGQLDPHTIRIPGIFVDVIVIAQHNEHPLTFSEQVNTSYLGQGLPQQPTQCDSSPLTLKHVIARQASMELIQGAIINYGIGVPECISQVIHEESVSEQVVATVEPGAIGGTPAGGLSFGASSFPDAIITQDQMFDFYDGGGLEQAFLGLAEVDSNGDLNVSKFGNKLAGCGGFIDISQNAKSVYFCGTFTTGTSQIAITEQGLDIKQDGAISKFIKQVQQITFSANYARQQDKPVLYITERAVFQLTQSGIELIEIAPGVDLQKDILDKMEFTPQISPNLIQMDKRIFSPELMQLKLKPAQAPNESQKCCDDNQSETHTTESKATATHHMETKKWRYL